MSNNGGGYFSHDANARNSAKIIRLRMRYGAEGYGVYFMLLERLREEQTYSCECDYDMLAFDFRVDANLIRAVVEDFSLFDIDGRRFYSRGFLARMAQKDEKSSRRSAAGRKGMQSRWSATTSDNNVITNTPASDNNVITNVPDADNNVITMLSQKDNNVITKENGVITMLSENITSKVKERKEKKRKEEDDVVVKEESSSSATEEAKALSGEAAHAAAHTAASANASAANAVAPEANDVNDADNDQANDDDRIADELTALKLDMQWGEAIAMRYGIDGVELHAMINKFGIDCHANGRLRHNSLADAKSHFCSWLRIQQSHNTPRHESNHQPKAAARRGTAATAQSSSQYSTRL